TTVLGQMSEIRELQATDRRRQTVISELLRKDHRRSTEISELRVALQGQVTALQGQFKQVIKALGFCVLLPRLIKTLHLLCRFLQPIGHSRIARVDHQKVQLNELNELRDQAYENSLIYKEKTKRIHDSKIKDRVFNVGDRVLHFNSRLKIFSSKLKTHWTGPFTITQVFPYDTVELSQTDGPNFKVNGHRLKHYFGEDMPLMVVPDLQTFPIDQ
nr:reverse transcriptase domain-containing protein [Tanacetum cinerariifolium]